MDHHGFCQLKVPRDQTDAKRHQEKTRRCKVSQKVMHSNLEPSSEQPLETCEDTRKSLKCTSFPLTTSYLSFTDLLKPTYHYLPLLIHTGQAACVQQGIIKYGQELHSSTSPLFTINSLSTFTTQSHTYTRTHSWLHALLNVEGPACRSKQPPAVCFQLVCLYPTPQWQPLQFVVSLCNV